MKFLFPIIIIGALLASQIAWAEETSPAKTTAPVRVGFSTSATLAPCKTKVQERRAKRLLRWGRQATCLIMTASSSSVSSSLSSSSSSASSTVFTQPSGTFDPTADATVQSQYLLLGEVGPVIGAATVFLGEEPLDITSISVNLASASSTVQSLSVFDQSRRFLGVAHLDATATNRTYKLSLTPGTLQIGKREEHRFYVRPSLLSKDLGGQGGQFVEIGNFVFEGNGVWSSQKYVKGSSETFLTFMTARSTITGIKNALQPTASLVSGTQRMLGSFVFEGHRSDSSAHIDVTGLTFHLSTTGGAQVGNVFLGADGTGEKVACVNTSSEITCAVPDSHGSLADGPRTLTLYGDVSVTDLLHASLQVSLDEPGSPVSPGSVTWSDGTSVFTWVALDPPLASGTLWKY